MTVTAASYDDGEDVPGDGDGFVDQYAAWLERVRAIADPATRRAIMALIVVAVFKGRAGR